MNALTEYAAYIDAHRNLVLENLDPESVEVYAFLSERFADCNASKDRVFQFVFRSFYRLDSAGLTKAFKAEYFRTLEVLRGTKDVDVAALVRHFHAVPRLKGDHSLQFSFATKLAHTVSAAYPIYDDEIATAFAFRRPGGGDLDARLTRLLAFYAHLRSAYMAILAENLLEGTRRAFRARFPGRSWYLPDIKVLDFLFWSAGKLIRTRRLIRVPNLVFEAPGASHRPRRCT